MKKLICLALVLVSLIGVLSGCCCCGGESILPTYECGWCGSEEIGFPMYTYTRTYYGIETTYDICKECYDMLSADIESGY